MSDTIGVETSSPDEGLVNAFIAKVGRRVREARQQKAISRNALSELSGISQRYLAQLESGQGNISIALLYKVAAALGHTPDWLLGEDEPWDTETFELVENFRSASSSKRAQIRQILAHDCGSLNKKRKICLIGLRGAGKSTLGQLLSKDLSFEFFELNQAIEELSGMAVGEVIALYGQEGFRRLERQAVDTMIETDKDIVLAVGGGIVSEPETFAQLRREFHTIWLKAEPEDHMQRVRDQGDERPMAGNPQAMAELKSILTSREALYARANATVDTSRKTLTQSRSDLYQVATDLLEAS